MPRTAEAEAHKEADVHNPWQQAMRRAAELHNVVVVGCMVHDTTEAAAVGKDIDCIHSKLEACYWTQGFQIEGKPTVIVLRLFLRGAVAWNTESIASKRSPATVLCLEAADSG